MIDIHKLEAISKNLSGDKSPLSWFDDIPSVDKNKIISSSPKLIKENKNT